ncbi:DUF2608 domain-containing protein [Rickettsia asembonensis]|uniref:DUF2608 domain-containing protein n=1 Tax=Rickettsia asembonensis TaxID=1068590 RepID=UPI001F51981B|nr:DUF2608 domain-containing protein [Rickettsia asembonensis]
MEFSDNEELAACNSGQKDDAICYKGIFITGNHSKSGTLSKFFEELNASFIVFIDDREKHVEDVRDYCKKIILDF